MNLLSKRPVLLLRPRSDFSLANEMLSKHFSTESMRSTMYSARPVHRRKCMHLQISTLIPSAVRFRQPDAMHKIIIGKRRRIGRSERHIRGREMNVKNASPNGMESTIAQNMAKYLAGDGVNVFYSSYVCQQLQHFQCILVRRIGERCQY